MSDITPPNNMAFPLSVGPQDYAQYGLTIRQEFAARVMQGMISGDGSANCLTDMSRRWLAKNAVLMADELINALDATGEGKEG